MTTEVTSPAVPERNKGEALLDVQYGVCFNNLNARLYKRLDTFFSLVNVIGGTVTLASAIAGAPVWAGTVGVVIAVCAYIEREVRPAEKAVRCELHRQKYGELAAKAGSLDLAEIDRELRILQSTGPDTIAGLERPAYNRNVTSHGYPGHQLPLTRWEKLMSCLA